MSITRNNLLKVLWEMLKASDKIDLKPSLCACSGGRDFISMSNVFVVIIFFRTCDFFSLNKKRMNGRSKIFVKKDRPPCLFKSKYRVTILFSGEFSLIGNLLLAGRAHAVSAR